MWAMAAAAATTGEWLVLPRGASWACVQGLGPYCLAQDQVGQLAPRSQRRMG